MSRPPKPIKRQQKLTVYYTKAEMKLIAKWSVMHALSRAEFVRAKSLDHQVRPRLTPEEINFYRQLAGMANNLNQLAHAANSGRVFTLQIMKALQGINYTIERLK